MDTLEQYIKPSKYNRQKRRDKRLHEEVIECGRYNGGDKHKKSRTAGRRKYEQQAQVRDDFPQHEAIRFDKKLGYGTWPSDNLEPLERWLASHVGMHWSKVYAELGNIIKPNTMHGQHIKEHLWQYVTQNAWIDAAGELHIPDAYGAIIDRKWRQCSYFVHPVTGILSKIPQLIQEAKKGLSPKKARWKKEKEKLKTKIKLGIYEKPTPPRPGIDLSAWSCIRTRDKRLKVGDGVYIEQKDVFFTATIKDIRLGHSYTKETLNGITRTLAHPALIMTVTIGRIIFIDQSAIKIGETHFLTQQENKPVSWVVYDLNRSRRHIGFLKERMGKG